MMELSLTPERRTMTRRWGADFLADDATEALTRGLVVAAVGVAAFFCFLEAGVDDDDDDILKTEVMRAFV